MKRRAGSSLIALVTGLLVVVLAGCGSDSKSGQAATGSSSSPSGSESSAQIAEWKKIVADASKPDTEFHGPTESPKAAPGKFVVSIPCGLAGAGCKFVDEALHHAADAIGWRIKTIDGKFDPTVQANAVNQAIQLGANAIVMNSVPASVAAGPLAKARQKGIAVISLANGPQASPPNLVQHDVDFGFTKEGVVSAAYIASQSGGKANIAIINDPSSYSIGENQRSFEENIKQCSGCKIDGTLKFSLADLGTTFSQQAGTFLQAHPNVDWIWVGFDGIAAPLVPVLKQLGLSQKVKIVSADGGNAQNVAFINDGDSQVATNAVSYEQAGWVAIDQANRVLNGEQPVKITDDGIPHRLITKDNASEYLTKGFVGEDDFPGAYKKLWGR